jgi:hypothetical protein
MKAFDLNYSQEFSDQTSGNHRVRNQSEFLHCLIAVFVVFWLFGLVNKKSK